MLYTEMQSSGSILHGNGSGLEYDHSELPLALQVGGNDPVAMAACASRAQQQGFSEVNINVGCPSSRVVNANFGAGLFRDPELVADCVRAMREAAAIAVTVKTRTGVDDMDAPEHLDNFVDKVSAAGCEVFIIHARKAWLSGLNPKQNRTVPPLCYDRVRQLKKDFPRLEIILNGGIEDLHHGIKLMPGVDGVMLGRAIAKNPWQMLEADQLYFGDSDNSSSRSEILSAYLDYMTSFPVSRARYSKMLQPLLNLLRGFPGARSWRRSVVTGGEAALTELRRQLPRLTVGGKCAP